MKRKTKYKLAGEPGARKLYRKTHGKVEAVRINNIEGRRRISLNADLAKSRGVFSLLEGNLISSHHSLNMLPEMSLQVHTASTSAFRKPITTRGRKGYNTLDTQGLDLQARRRWYA
jgi:hypothetical protein